LRWRGESFEVVAGQGDADHDEGPQLSRENAKVVCAICAVTMNVSKSDQGDRALGTDPGRPGLATQVGAAGSRHAAGRWARPPRSAHAALHRPAPEVLRCSSQPRSGAIDQRGVAMAQRRSRAPHADRSYRYRRGGSGERTPSPRQAFGGVPDTTSRLGIDRRPCHRAPNDKTEERAVDRRDPRITASLRWVLNERSWTALTPTGHPPPIGVSGLCVSRGGLQLGLGEADSQVGIEHRLAADL
jgi:hypothetical protein